MTAQESSNENGKTGETALVPRESGTTSDRPSFDRTDRAPRGGSVWLVLAIAVALVGTAAGLIHIGRSQAEPYILGVLAFLATIGVFSLFAIAAGILQTTGRSGGHPIAKAITDGAFDGVIVTDKSGRVFYANAAYLDLTKAENPDDVRPIERAFSGDPDVSEAIYRLLKAGREGQRLQEEIRIAGSGQNEAARWLRMRVRPLGESRADRSLTVWSVADITRERARQENVFQELQHAIDYLDHAPAGFFSADASGTIVYLNATLAMWLGHDLAQVGTGALHVNDIAASDGAALLTAFKAAPGEVKTEIIDIDLKARDGKPIPVRLFHKIAFGADGEPGLSRTLVINRSSGEGTDPLRAAEVRFMRFFQNTPMAIATVDKAGRIVRSNARFARNFQDALKRDDRSILSVVPDSERASLETVIAKAASGQSDLAPVEAQLAGTGDRFATFFVSAVEEADGEAAIVYVLETTAQRALENRMNQQQKMESVGQLAGGIAHDFNNVLSAIMMATDFLLNAHKPTDPSFADIMQIKQNANRAASLVRHLLAFSRRQTLRPQVLDIGEKLEDLGMLLKRLIGEKVAFSVNYGRDLWPVKVDLSQFEQVIVNLAVNARDAMPEGGKLTVRTGNVSADDVAQLTYKGLPVAEYVRIEVADTGTGIPADIREKIFEPFFSTKEVGKGTGLGLSTVYGIVKQTGGFVYVDSEPGKGSVFSIFLPRFIPGEGQGDMPPVSEAATQSVTAAAEEVKKAAVDLTGQGTILLVEDEDGLRALNARGLASRGYTVLQAANGVEALEVFSEAEQVDLVVSDVVMPEMDGPTLLGELRKRNPDLKVIFVSGYAEEAFQKSLPEGVKFSFLAKPFTLKQLVATVKETMSG